MTHPTVYILYTYPIALFTSYWQMMTACTVFMTWMPLVPRLARMTLSVLERYMYLQWYKDCRVKEIRNMALILEI